MGSSAPKTIVMLASHAGSLVNFRGPLVRTLRDRGHEVVGMAPMDDRSAQWFAENGARFEAVPLERAGMDPSADVRALADLTRRFRRLRPDLLLAYTVKPIVYGSIAARIAGVERVASLVTGLGYAFTDSGQVGVKDAVVRRLVRGLYRVALRNNEVVFFLNPDDVETFVDAGLVDGSRARQLPGEGIDLERYSPMPLPEGPLRVLYMGRLLRDKGIRELVAASRELLRRRPETRVRLVGSVDDNPSSASPDEVAGWVAEGVVEHIPWVDDVLPHLAWCNVYALPSYREGTPRSTLEALAAGRPVVTTDVPGCRETVVDGHNGFLVPVRDVPALTAALERLADDPALREQFARRGLERVRERFEVGAVNRIVLEVLGL